MFFFTDASDVGMGGVLGNNWFSVGWPRGFSADCCSTNFQEIFAIFTAVTIWGSELCNKQLLIYCDNETVVTVINSGTCKNNRIMDVVRGIFFVCAKNNISLFAEHVPGVENEMADALSRLQEERFARLHPTARKNSTPVPRSVWTI